MRNNSISRKILLAVGETAKDVLKAGVDIIVDPRSIVGGSSLYQNSFVSSSLASKGIKNLKRYGYLREKKDGNKKILCLTQKGRVKIIKNILRQKRDKKLRWDGKWRAIVFDVPESSRKDRDFLRRELRWIGFIELQKSIWIFPYKMERELKLLLEFWKTDFAGDIRFLIIEEMDDKNLREYFDL